MLNNKKLTLQAKTKAFKDVMCYKNLLIQFMRALTLKGWNLNQNSIMC